MTTDAKPARTYQDFIQEAARPVGVNHQPGQEYAADKRYFQGISGVEITPSGRLYATWYAGGQGESPLNYVMLAHSDDRGDNWSQPELVIDPPGMVRAYDPCVWYDPQGKLWLFWMQGHTLHDGRGGVWAITTTNPDAEKPQWSQPVRLMDGVMLNKPTILADGSWLFCVSLLSSQYIGNDRRMVPAFLRGHILQSMTPEEVKFVDDRQGAYVYRTVDQGQHFEAIGCVKVDPAIVSHNEHMIVERSDGSLLMLLRTKDGIAQSTSKDAGRSWTPVVASDLPHPSSRFYIRSLDSGKLLLVKHGPLTLPDDQGQDAKLARTHMTAYLSQDDGQSWHGGLVLQEAGCSYPDGCQSRDGVIYITYDMGRRAEKKIMLARFTEADVMEKKLVTPGSHCELIINQATGVIKPEESWSRMKELENTGEKLIFTGI